MKGHNFGVCRKCGKYHHYVGFKARKWTWNKGLHIYCGGRRFEKGQIPWNKGLTKETDTRVATYSQKLVGHHYSPERNLKLCRIPDLVSSAELAYVIGAWLGDGDKNALRFRVKDEDIALEFARCLARVLHKEKIRVNLASSGYGRRDYFSISQRNKFLLSFLKDNNYKDIVLAFPADFLRGFFDTEGWVYIKNKLSNRVEIGCSNTNFEVMVLVSHCLDLLGIDYRTHSRKPIGFQECYHITISKSEAVGLFRQKVGFSCKRKSDTLAMHLT